MVMNGQCLVLYCTYKIDQPNGTLLARWGDKTHPGTVGRGRCGSDSCRDSNGSTSGAMRKTRYWALKKYKEMVDSFEIRPRELARCSQAV